MAWLHRPKRLNYNLLPDSQFGDSFRKCWAITEKCGRYGCGVSHPRPEQIWSAAPGLNPGRRQQPDQLPGPLFQFAVRDADQGDAPLVLGDLGELIADQPGGEFVQVGSVTDQADH